MIQNRFYIGEHWALFVGALHDNRLHKHYALQVSVASQGSLIVTDKNGVEHMLQSCFIQSNFPHQIFAEHLQATILINPLSVMGHQLHVAYHHSELTVLEPEFVHAYKASLTTYGQGELSFAALIACTQAILATYQSPSIQYTVDPRIQMALQYIERNFERIVSLKEISDHCALSETRFLHLFKEKTKLNFRRYQLWNKLIKSIPHLQQHSITDTAHTFGFTDSAHYGRTFSETFGLLPKSLSKLQ